MEKGGYTTMNTDEKTDRQQILDAVAEYYSKHISPNSEYVEGDRIPYAARVFDDKEMCALVDSALDFWLTSGRYCDQFEREFATYVGAKYCYLVNSGSSANLLAFMH